MRAPSPDRTKVVVPAASLHNPLRLQRVQGAATNHTRGYNATHTRGASSYSSTSTLFADSSPGADASKGLYRYSKWQTGPPLHTLPRPASFSPEPSASDGASIRGCIDRVSPPPSLAPSPAPLSPRRVPLTAWVPGSSSLEATQREIIDQQRAQKCIRLVDVFLSVAIDRPLPDARPVFQQYRTTSLVIWAFSAIHDLEGKALSVEELPPDTLNDHWERSLLLTSEEHAWIEAEQNFLNILCGLSGR
ncbi:hypothetical protein AURDEDRAFT_163207 [Auricularia subglabra TFB-10046 SS5]|nr:hypothetical protein AURDEDRAFT_163207 [Auricularia subglabra TFB-10046 SS5]